MRKFLLLAIVFQCYCSSFSFGFALLSHQAIIDATWEKSIQPLLKKKYPNATEKELKDAYSYLYGGALMPDIGYSPFGSKMFTNLVHYVRTGDFITNLINESENMNEYAFSLGFLCHYQADKYGHSMGTNLAVPILFPKLKEEHGDVIAYEKGCSEHTRVEFGFDVIQTAKGNYDLDAKHKFVAFKVSEPVLKRAFKKTYGMELSEIFGSLPLAVETFRFAVKQLIPELTQDAWRARNASILVLNPLAKKKSYTQKFERKKYRKEFGRPGLKSILFSVIIAIVPKIGPTSGLKYKEPDERVDKIFDTSFKAIVENYSASLTQLESKNFRLDNINFDTGKKTNPGSYQLEDDTYYKLLKKHRRNDFSETGEALKKDFLAFFSDPELISRYNRKKSKQKTINESLTALSNR